MDLQAGLSSDERQELIFRIIKEQKRIRLTQISKSFGISIATARRDLENLAKENKVERVHGGAILTRKAPPEMAVQQRQIEQAEEKQRIGRETAQMISEGETVLISNGTTPLEVAKNLVDRENLTVITNSLPVLCLLANNPKISVICLGGQFRNKEAAFIGHITEGNLEEVHADKVIIGTRSLSLVSGLTADYLSEVMTDRAILRISSEVIVVADYTKFDRVSTASVAPLSAIQTVVTDDKASPEFVDGLRARGIRVVIV